MSSDASGGAARAAHVVHERPLDAAFLAELLSASPAPPAEAGPVVLIIVPEVEDAMAAAAAASWVVPVTSVKRGARLHAASRPTVAGRPADLLALRQKSALPVAGVARALILDADRFDTGDLEALDALLAEVPAGDRVVSAAQLTPEVASLIERHLQKPRRVSAAGVPVTGLPAVQVVTGPVSGRAAQFAHVLDELDPPSVVVLAEGAGDRAAAEAVAAQLGLGSAVVIGASGPVPAQPNLLVWWGCPSPRAVALAAEAQPARAVALVRPRERAALAAACTGATLAPLALGEAARAARAADVRLRAALRHELAMGLPMRELSALEPLFEAHDAADVAAAAVRLADRLRGRVDALQAELAMARAATAAPAMVRGGERGGERRDDRKAPMGREGRAPAGRGGAGRGDRPPGKGYGAKGSGPRGFGAKASGPKGFGPKGFGRGRPPRGPEEGGPRGEWQERGERLRHSKRRRDGA